MGTDDTSEKIKAFRDLSERLRKETGSVPQTPSHVLIREDRDSGHRDAYPNRSRLSASTWRRSSAASRKPKSW